MVCTRCLSGWLVLKLVECDLDFDLHAIWQDSSDMPMPPPCLATDPGKARQISVDEGEPAGYETQGSSVIECFLHPTHDKLSAFKWTGPDPLSMSTQASDLFLHRSALTFPKEVFWIEFRLVRLTGNLARLQKSICSSCPELRRPHGIFVGYVDSC